MAKTYQTIYTNAGNMLQDTSSATQTLLKVWINDAYQDAWRRCMWTELINEDFTFQSVVDQADYTFASISLTDFGEDVFMANTTYGHPIQRFQVRRWWDERSYDYNAGSLQSGSPRRYIVLPESSSLRLDAPPSEIMTFAMPYKKTVTDLSATGDTPSLTNPDISQYLEDYTTAMGQLYFNQYQKANFWLTKAEHSLAKTVKENNVKFNQQYLRLYSYYTGREIHRLTGDLSYDSI